jgi:poly(3-hydroxybutyrate) depolymerase
MKRIVLLLAMLAMVALAPVPALAQGQVERGPAHANSICSFSGQNDTPNAPFPEGGRVQSYGQLVSKGLKSEVPSPGELCNGHTHPYPEAFPPPAP